MKKTAAEIADDVLSRLGPEREEDMKLLNYLPSSYNYAGPAPHLIEDDAKLREALREWKQGFVRRGVGVTAGLSGILGGLGAYAGATTSKDHPVLGGIAGGLIGAAGGALPLGIMTRSFQKDRDQVTKLSPEELNSIRRLSAYGGGFDSPQRLGITKTSGYWQNIVGMDDPATLKKLRKQYLDYYAAEDKYDKEWDEAQRKSGLSLKEYVKAYPYKPPTRPNMDKIKAIGGKELGVFGKYWALPEMIGFSATEPMSGMPTKRGYLSKKDLLKHISKYRIDRMGWEPEEENKQIDIVELIKKSPHKYYTSTYAG